MANERKTEISYLNILFCLFVIFIHIISYCVVAFEYGSLKYNVVMFPWRMVSIVVPGFIMLSGVKLFLTGKDSMPYHKYLFSRIKSIIIPYTLCFAVYYICYMVAYGYVFDIKFIFDQYIHGSLVCHLYFIPLLFQFDLLFPLWKRIINKVNPIILLPVVFLVTSLFAIHYPNMVTTAFPESQFLYNDRFFMTYLCYWIMGCYIGKYYDKFCEILKQNFKAICVIFALVFAMFVYYTYLAFNYITYIPFMNYVHDLYVICVIIFLYALFLKLPKNMPKILTKLDRASFNIYLWHMIFVLAADHIIERLSITAQSLSFAIRFILAYLVTIPLCVAYSQLKRKIKFRNADKTSETQNG